MLIPVGSRVWQSNRVTCTAEVVSHGTAKRGKRTKGYWFRSGRGWYVSTGAGRYAKLCDDTGEHLQDEKDLVGAQHAFARYLLEKPGPVSGDRILMVDLCNLYVTEWISAHPGWKAGGRMAVRALNRAINFAVDQGFATRNPIRGILRTLPPEGNRVTFLTEEMETAICSVSPPAFAMAVKVCIETGARPVCEFAAVLPEYVVETEKGQQWRFPRQQTKTRKRDRVILVPPDIAAVVRQLIKQNSDGPVFRNSRGKPWTDIGLRRAFQDSRKKLAKQGLDLPEHACFYSCRHTFAKRKLGEGYSLETIAGLLGNTPSVCWKNYAQWSDVYVDPLWKAVNGK